MATMQDGVTAPLVKQCDALKSQAAEKDASLHKVTMDCEHLAAENRHLKFQLKRLDGKLAAKDRCSPALHGWPPRPVVASVATDAGSARCFHFPDRGSGVFFWCDL